MGNNDNHIIRIATYARVSTAEQATEGTSLDVQDNQLKVFCQAQGWVIANTYIDPGFSGKDGERPALKRLLADAKFNLFEKVVVCKLDRMARNLRLLLSIESQLREYQISFTSIKESIDTSTSTGKIVFQMFGMIAEWERETIIERTKSGRLQRYKEGSWGPGNPPYGYDYNRETRKLTINPAQSGIIKRIYEVYSSGKSMTYIANMLNEEKISPRGKKGKGWFNTSVRNVIYNPVYKGEQIVNVHQANKGLPDELPEKAIRINVPAIVDKALWNIAQEHRKNNKRLHSSKNDYWLLQGIISCGLCGYSYKTEYVHGRRRYGCRGRLKYSHIDGSPRCTSPHVNADSLEGEVWKRIEDVINDPNRLESILAKTVNSLREREADLTARIKPIDKRLSEISLQKSKLAEEWVLSSIDPHRIQELKKSLDQEELRLKSIRSEIDPAQLEELQHTSAMLNYWNKQLEALNWNTEMEDGRMVRVVDKPHQAVLKIVGMDDKELSGILHFPATKREILDLLQVKVVVFPDRVEVKALFPIEPINNQVLQPTISLFRYLDISLLRALRLDEIPDKVNIPCQQSNPDNIKRTIGFIEDAGEARFQEKASSFLRELQDNEADQTLYRGIMGALGYTKNKGPCLELATKLPLNVLNSAITASQEESINLACLQAFLFGSAGLLPSQRTGTKEDEYSRYLEYLWTKNIKNSCMSADDWILYKVRPNNLPIRRIAAMSHLILLYRDSGLLQSLIQQVMKVELYEADLLVNNFLVNSDVYWRNHYDFGFTCTGLQSMIGPDRAAEIVINVLLPFVYARGKYNKDDLLEDKALTLYHHLHNTKSNGIEKQMFEQLALKRKAINSACQQQGLLHIYRKLCIQNKCSECKLSNFN